MNFSKEKVILIISHVVPYPPRAGNEYRIYRFILFLRSIGYTVVLLLNVDSLHSGIKISLKKIVDDVYLKNDSIFFSPLLNFKRKIFSFLKKKKSKIEALKESYSPYELKQATRILCNIYHPTVVVAEYIFSAPCLNYVPKEIFKIIDTHDVFSRRKADVQRYGINDMLYCTPEEEGNYLLNANIVLAIQSHEKEILQKLVPEKKVITVGVDFEILDTVKDSTEEKNNILLVGSNNLLNIHGLYEFYEKAWPLIKTGCPEAMLTIVGSIGSNFHPNDKNIIIKGMVHNLDYEYEKATVVINPVIAGTGLKVKSVEAIAAGKPLVTTVNGAEGIDDFEDPPYISCEDWNIFSQAIIELFNFQEKRLDLSRRALNYARKKFTSSAVYSEIEAHLQFLRN